MALSKRERGAQGENLAVDYLMKKGYRILERNFRFEHGEIDIVAEERDILVFVEVKTRGSALLGHPEDAVTISKQNILYRAAEGYLYKNNIDGKECRFDVIAILHENGKVNIKHYEHAF